MAKKHTIKLPANVKTPDRAPDEYVKIAADRQKDDQLRRAVFVAKRARRYPGPAGRTASWLLNAAVVPSNVVPISYRFVRTNFGAFIRRQIALMFTQVIAEDERRAKESKRAKKAVSKPFALPNVEVGDFEQDPPRIELREQDRDLPPGYYRVKLHQVGDIMEAEVEGVLPGVGEGPETGGVSADYSAAQPERIIDDIRSTLSEMRRIRPGQPGMASVPADPSVGTDHTADAMQYAAEADAYPSVDMHGWTMKERDVLDTLHVVVAPDQQVDLPIAWSVYQSRVKTKIKESSWLTPKVGAEIIGYQHDYLSAVADALPLFHKDNCDTKKAQTKSALAEKYPQYYKEVPAHVPRDEVDTYVVNMMFPLNDPTGTLLHARKKLLVPGVRSGGKDLRKDITEARDSLDRWLALNP